MTRTTAELLADLEVRLEQSLNPGSPRAIARRAEKGLPGPRERIRMLLDRGSFIEVGQMARNPGAPDNPYGDGVVTGHGTVDGRPVAVFSHDHTVFGGSVGEMFGRKVASIMEFAARIGCPCVGINDSGGARVQDAVTSLAWYAEMGRRQIPLSGVCPQVSILLGKCAGGAAYAPINTDLVVAVDEQAYMFVTGPGVIKSVTGEDVTLDELGGARAQAENGNVHHVAPSEEAAFAWVREYLGFLPSSRHEEAPIVNPGLEPEITDNDLALNEFMPDADNAAYDMHDLLLNIFDDGDFHELAAQTAPNVITGFSRVDGRSVGVVANQPQFLSGALDQVSADKAARFVRICDAYEIPLVFVVDTPGFLPGLEQERNGVLRSGGRFLQAFAAATVPKVTVVVRKFLRRWICGDGVQATRCRRELRLADRTHRGHGRRGRDQSPLPPRTRSRRRRTGRDAAATRRRLQRERRDTVFGRRARLHRRGDRTIRHPARDPAGADVAPRQALRPRRAEAPPDSALTAVGSHSCTVVR